MTPAEKTSFEGFGKYRDSFCEAMDDDLNSADAVAVIFELIREVNTLCAEKDVTKVYAEEALKMVTELCSVLSIGETETDDIGNDIKQLIEKRQQARKEKNYAEADRIRDELKARGIVLEDTPQGVKAHRVK